MIITTTFSPGDLIWTCSNGALHQLTVGQVRVVVTDSPGTGDEMFDNYKAQSAYLEEYMCVETGIGGGRVYELGKTAFLSREACAQAYADELAVAVRWAEAARQHKRERAQVALQDAQRQLQELEGDPT